MPIDRNDPCPCGSGLKYKKCHALAGSLPVEVYRVNRAIAYAGRIGRMREEFCRYYLDFKQTTIADMEKRLHQSTASGGESISCAAGCTHCCNLFVFATLEEAECIVYYLYNHEEALLNFLASYRERWRRHASVQRLLPVLVRLLGQSLQGKLTAAEKSLFDSLAAEYSRQKLPCPFLSAGRCAIYPVRPFTCAGVVATTPPDWCRVDSGHGDEARYSRLVLKQTCNMPYFLKEKTSVSYGCLPDLVYRLLEHGYGWLENMTEATGLCQEVARDREVAGILTCLGSPLPV